MLAVDIGGTKMAAAVVDGSGSVLAEARVPTPASTDPEVVFGALASLVDSVRADAWLDPTVCGVGCGGPMAAGGRDGEPPEHPRLGPLPAPGPSAPTPRPSGGHRQRRQGAGPRRGMAGVLPGALQLPGDGGVHRGGRRHRASTAGSSTALGAMRATSATWWSSRTAARASAGVGAASRPRHRVGRSSRSPAGPPPEAPESVRRRTGTLVGRAVASVANLLDLELAVVAGSVALGLRRGVLRRGPGRDRPPGATRLLPVHPDPPGRPGSRRAPGRGGGGRAPGPRRPRPGRCSMDGSVRGPVRHRTAVGPSQALASDGGVPWSADPICGGRRSAALRRLAAPGWWSTRPHLPAA